MTVLQSAFKKTNQKMETYTTTGKENMEADKDDVIIDASAQNEDVYVSRARSRSIDEQSNMDRVIIEATKMANLRGDECAETRDIKLALRLFGL